MAVYKGLWLWDLVDHKTAQIITRLVGVSQPNLQVGLNQNSQCQITAARDPLLKQAMRANTDDDFVLVGQRWNDLTSTYGYAFAGPCQSLDEYVGDTLPGTVGISAVGAYDWLNCRYCDNAAHAGLTTNGMSYNADPCVLSGQLIRDTNTVDGYTWLRAAAGNQTPLGGNPVTITNWGGGKVVADAITELSVNFEWLVEAACTTDAQGVIFGNYFAAPQLGTDKSASVVFEQGGALHNVAEAHYKRDRTGYGNRYNHFADGTDPYRISSPNETQIGSHGVWDVSVDLSATDQTIRQAWCDRNVQARSNSRKLIEITCNRTDMGTAPQPFRDVNLGDTCRVIIPEMELDGNVRIYNMQITRDDTTGAETTAYSFYHF